MKGITIDFQESDTWKIQLAIAINFVSSKDAEEERSMHSKNDNEEFMIYDNTNNIIDELCKSLLSRYKKKLETSMRGIDFFFDSTQLLYYKCHRINWVIYWFSKLD